MSAHKLPTTAHTFVIFDGRRFPVLQESRGWRLRSRAKNRAVDVLLGHGSRQWAERKAKEVLAGGALLAPKACKGTLAELVEHYQAMPKRAGEDAAYTAICALRSCVRLALGKELDAVKVSDITAGFWLDYCAKRQGWAVADLSTRRVENSAINAAMRQAASILFPRLRPAFAAAGFVIRDDATVIQWLPEIRAEKPEVAGAMLKAWAKLPRGALWLTIGLARFAGLRRDEIEHITRAWLVEDKGALHILLRDRPEEQWLSKTGRKYRAAVIHGELAKHLLASGPGYLVNPPAEDRHRWFEVEPQKWLKPFTKARLPLHRLRGLYADDVARITADAVSARLAGIEAASKSLGHTSTKTTTDHYLSDAL